MEITKKNSLKQHPCERVFVQNPYAMYQYLHAQGTPVFWENYGFWCFANFSTVNQILRDHRFARLPPSGHETPPLPEHLDDFSAVEKHSLLSLEPPLHTRLRRRVNRAFMSRQVGLMALEIEALAQRCIDSFEANKETDLLSHYATPIPLTVITQLLGVPEPSGPQLIQWSHAMVKIYTLTQSLEEEIQANTAAAEFRHFLLTIIQQKREVPGNDLLSALLRDDEQHERLTDDEIISVAILLLNAGHEATVHQLGNAIKQLLEQYPLGEKRHVLHQLLQDDDKADALVTECLRHDAPLHLFTRYAQETITLESGLTLQPGEQVGLLLAAANRCPHRFKQADHFNPQREDAGHLSFGAGLHFCIGAPLARLELRIALQVLFTRLPTLSLNGSPEYVDAYHFHGLRQLRVRW